LIIKINLYCSGSIEAIGWIKAGGLIEAGGIKTKKYYIIIGKRWNIYVLDNHIKIGCECHLKKDWQNFTDEEIKIMDAEALNFWGLEKNFILGL